MNNANEHNTIKAKEYGFDLPKVPMNLVNGYRRHKAYYKANNRQIDNLDPLEAFNALLSMNETIPFIYGALLERADNFQELYQSIEALIQMHNAFNNELQADFDEVFADISQIIERGKL